MTNFLIGLLMGVVLGAVFHSWFARQAGGLEKKAEAEVTKIKS